MPRTEQRYSADSQAVPRVSTPSPPRIALFGGSFDPVHLGHLLVAQAAREELGLSRLFFVPAAQSPFKPELKTTPANLRLRLLRLALAGNAWCEIDEQEIRRGGVSYTIETLRDYARGYPQATLFYLIGEDHLPALPRWREARALAQLAEFVVIPRPTRCAAGAAGAGQTSDIQHPTSNIQRSSTPAHQHSANPSIPDLAGGGMGPSFRVRRLAGFPLGISSSQIRARVKAGLPIEHLTSPAVAEAIRDNRLYL
jgi:nicotinate-nucleotide adenylyltransferase